MTPNRPGTSRLRAIVLSLATAALGTCALSGAAHADAEYIWVRQNTPPADAVTAVGSNRALCRTIDARAHMASEGSLWLGWFDGVNCQSHYGGSVVFPVASHRFEFLVPTPGHTTQWVDMGVRPLHDRNADALSGGHNDYMDTDMYICSQGASTGYMTWRNGGGAGYSRCETSSPGHPGGEPQIYKLVGTIVSIYNETGAGPSGASTARDSAPAPELAIAAPNLAGSCPCPVSLSPPCINSPHWPGSIPCKPS